ncbi:MAG: lipoate--protein ligase family protein [Deltaproteobacteria bacterium]|nr:lipoate--protein ligase family protein [Deltaproteobacteria bacterium]MBW1952966.1 lipoate--protein ligase family protein [Deltaproteobacteria bacterium]MBW1987492.1 lipoate--protein ligase family protein [Deltaproteobacteria bacterium]MBW2134524.1 lipoate--protein ligase family protein [Deltaproteobacteria bacterium]
MKPVWRLLDHGPGPADWNMAVDEALLVAHVEDCGPASLRFYHWSAPTLSLGAGQEWPAHLCDQILQALGLDLVRRPTGGRAVLHGGDLTYCLVAGTRDGFPVSTTAIYRRLGLALKAGLKKLGIVVESGAASRSAPSFACFARATPADLTWQGRKFIGSAQLWRGQSFLQHGSIILESQEEIWRRLLSYCRAGSFQLWPMVSLAEILKHPVSLAALKTALLEGFQEVLGVEFRAGELSEREEIRAAARCSRIRLEFSQTLA